jgi:transcriptional regulator with XRE-family HTH domain
MGPARSAPVDQTLAQGSRHAARVDQHVGERIRKRRTLLGYTQEQLADALEISYQQVQKYETGANRVSAGRLFQIAQRLDVSVAYFFDGLELTAQAASMPHGGANRTTIDLVRNFNAITDLAVRNSLAALVKSLSERHENGANGDDAARSFAEFASAGKIKAE